jgi:hypothetical protein
MDKTVPVKEIAKLFPDKVIAKIKPFAMFYSGWECDETGYIVTFDSMERTVVLTDHGVFYQATREEMERYVETLGDALSHAEIALGALLN